MPFGNISRAMRQIILIGIICFGTIGMYNAMSSIGNAGKHSPMAQNYVVTSSSIAYIVGFLLAGGTHNMLGPRLCVLLGGITFVLYAGAMMLAKDDDRSIYPPLAGILLGLGAGLIWVTQGAMMMSYPTEDNKGKYISTFWAIFNLGAVLGSVLPLALNSAPGMDPDDVSSATYIVYMAVMGLATSFGFFLSKPSTIVKDDGEPVNVAKFAGLKAEGLAILSVFCDWRMLLLIPAFFFSNFSYTYQFNDFNGFPFNIRTRCLNSIVFWVAQIIGALLIGYLLDRIPVRRPMRAMLGLLVIALLFMATWIAALCVQIRHKWERKPIHQSDLIDFEHGGAYTGLLFIYAMFGFCDAAFAVFCYWIMGALSNKHDELSRYAGFFKAIQSLGGAVAAPLDIAQTPLLAYLIINWILCGISIAAMFLVCRTITDTTIEYEEGDEMEDYEYDEELDDLDSYNRSIDEDCDNAHNEKQSNSFEGDISTICAQSDESQTPGVRHRKNKKTSRRSSKRTSSNPEDFIEADEDEAQHKSYGDFLEPVHRASFNSSSSSAASSSEYMTYPPQAYNNQHQSISHEVLDRNSLRRAVTPSMSEAPYDPSIGLGLGYWIERPSPAAGAHSSFIPQFLPSMPGSSASLYSNAQPSPGMFSHLDQVESSSIPASFIPTPTLMISHETSPPIPLYTFQPELPHNIPQWPTQEQLAIVNQQDQETEFTEEPNAMQFAPGLLQPHDYFVPAVRTASSAGSTRYDDDQDMDSIDTHSISSMSSEADSIPEMTEMGEEP